MKNTLIFSLLCSLFLSSCSFLSIAPIELRSYEKTFEVQDKNQDELFSLASKWCLDEVVSSKSKIEYENKEEGTIILRYISIEKDFIIREEHSQIIKIDIKNEKVRVTINNLIIDQFYNDGTSNSFFRSSPNL